MEVDRWAAHDYLLSLMKAVPSILDAKSIIEVDNLLLEFASAYCKGNSFFKSTLTYAYYWINLILNHSVLICYFLLLSERRSTISGGVLTPSDAADFADDAQIYDVGGTLLNADAVYAATIAALALNFRLLQAGFYSENNKRDISEIMTEVTSLRRWFDFHNVIMLITNQKLCVRISSFFYPLFEPFRESDILYLTTNSHSYNG